MTFAQASWLKFSFRRYSRIIGAIVLGVIATSSQALSAGAAPLAFADREALESLDDDSVDVAINLRRAGNGASSRNSAL